jgi:hypothetical protein
MSPEAIQSLIEMFGVEKGVQIMNLFTSTDSSEPARKAAVGLKRLRNLRTTEVPAPLPRIETISA